MKRSLFTSESVTEGHPDKICDKISDAILDAVIMQDPDSRVACETCCTTGIVFVMGEITTKARIDISQIARKVIKDIGYNSMENGFNGDSCAVITALDKQSDDIAMGVDCLGAGDQGMMFGYACSETPELMPLPISLAHKLCKKLTQVRTSGQLGYLRPDGKSQVTVEYDEKNNPIRVDTVVISCQHADDVPLEKIRNDIINTVIKPTIPKDMLDEETVYHINPTGRFVIGGPQGDSGLTGRKIIVDTYGGYAHHGGGAFSGKDPTKVDRSGAYMARYIAKNIVAADLAQKCEIQIAYAIGVPEPVSVMVNTYDTGKYSNYELVEAIKSVFDLRPESIINALNLRRPIYQKLSAYGHMGRVDLDVEWEKTNRVDELKDYFVERN